MGDESCAMGFLLKSGAFIAIVAVFIYACFPGEIMTGISSDIILSGWQLQLAVTGFCVSNVPAKFLKEEYSQDIGGDFDFAVDGDVENEDYNKGSIYSLLYALYANVGTVQSDLGVPYEFTFNTWGISPSPYPREDPQRHGKAAYSGLVHLPAIKTCKKKHGNVTNPNLKCVHVPAGVGNNGNKAVNEKGMPIPDGSIDFVIISETHIADIDIGPEEVEIFMEIKRILKPGGLFLWGNALPTRCWTKGFDVLESKIGLTRLDSLNHTKGAVIARDEDEARVNAYTSSITAQYPVFQYSGSRGRTCEHVVDRLIKNFYRHPGTALYLKMVSGFDSYMHESYQKPK